MAKETDKRKTYGDVIASMETQCCLTCKFYRADKDSWGGGDDFGQCKRFPPKESKEVEGYINPCVDWLGWCGEWKQDGRTDPWSGLTFNLDLEP